MAKTPLTGRRPPHTCGLCRTELKGLGVTIGSRKILWDIDLHINCGELTALVGPNGAGKTTLLKAILGEIRHSGALSFMDADQQRRQPVIGYVPQKLDFDPSAPVSVLDLLAASLTSRPVFWGHTRGIRERAEEILAGVEAQRLLDCRLGDLSGGELQRVLLALAMYPNPDLLLLDEPVSGVDALGKEMFYELVNELRKQYDLSILLVSHDLFLVSQSADRIILLDGTIKCLGTPREVFADKEMLRIYGSALESGWSQNIREGPIVADGRGGQA